MLQELSSALNVHKKEMIVPMVDSQFFYVEAEQTKGFLDQTMEMQEADMKFFNVKQSQPYSNSLDKATIVNNSNATITQQETFTKTTTGMSSVLGCSCSHFLQTASPSPTLEASPKEDPSTRPLAPRSLVVWVCSTPSQLMKYCTIVENHY